MGMSSHGKTSGYDALVQKAIAGDKAALAQLFQRYRKRLRKMIDLRMDRRIQGRVNPSDVLQEAYVDLADQLANYAKDPKLPLFIWVRRITGQRLAKTHRHHLGAAKRDAALEVSLYRGHMPQATSIALASKLIGNATSAEGKMLRAERQIKLQEVLNAMDPDDREVLAMRHFEQLTNAEVAMIFEVSESAAGMRHLRALRRLKQELKQLPELFDDFAMQSEALQSEDMASEAMPFEEMGQIEEEAG